MLPLAVSCVGVVVASSPLRPSALGPLERRALVLVRSAKVPWYAPTFVVTNRFIDTIPQYVAAPGLEHKAYTVSDDGRFGGVYLWSSRSAAEAWFDAAWHERVKRERGEDADVAVLDVRSTIDGQPVEGKPLPQHGTRADAAVSWLSTPPAAVASVEARLAALASAHGVSDAMARVNFVSDETGRVGVVVLWRSREVGRAFFTAEQLARLQQAAGSPLSVTWFAAPVLLDSAAAKKDLEATR